MIFENLFVHAYQDSQRSYWISIETLLILFIYRIINTDKVKLFVRLSPTKPIDALLNISLENMNYTISSKIPNTATFADGPIIISGNQVTAGVCSVARSLIKTSNSKDIRSLLGFKESCLLACSENSVWTRFCETDIIKTVKDILNEKLVNGDQFLLPETLLRFEFHLSTPIKMHNIYKQARVQNNNKDIKSGIPVTELNLLHIFSEGLTMTLIDVILYQCFEVIFKKIPTQYLEVKLPLINQWLIRMDQSFIANSKFSIDKRNIVIADVVMPDFTKHSLYSRRIPEKRMFTNQNDIDTAIEKLHSIEDEIVNSRIPFGEEVNFDWSDIPIEANPNGGALPKKRAARKQEQLENLAKAVIKIAYNKTYRIVDFCSGSGHLGILLATLLPNSEIVLVENKERSLIRAKERIEKLGLHNVLIVQSNLNYFKGDFDIGVALHACGVATDLVIQVCVQKKAHLVLCPCCYGGVRNCSTVTYPRSDKFQKVGLEYSDYLTLAHAADQTHGDENLKTKQGYVCMDIVDTDRKMYLESCGYEVYLGKLHPAECTNKNNLLVGLFKDFI